jgi:hypothetical protein
MLTIFGGGAKNWTASVRRVGVLVDGCCLGLGCCLVVELRKARPTEGNMTWQDSDFICAEEVWNSASSSGRVTCESCASRFEQSLVEACLHSQLHVFL